MAFAQQKERRIAPLPLHVKKVVAATFLIFALAHWSSHKWLSLPFARVRKVFRKRKTPRPRGKATRYEHSQRACGPSDTSWCFLTTGAEDRSPAP